MSGLGSCGGAAAQLLPGNDLPKPAARPSITPYEMEVTDFILVT